MPNEFDNVIMVAIVITCRANEKEGFLKKLSSSPSPPYFSPSSPSSSRRRMMSVVGLNERAYTRTTTPYTHM